MTESDLVSGAQRVSYGSALVVTVCAFLAMLIGLITQIVAAAFFGASATMDAYLAATNLPNYVYAVLLSALSTAIIPILITLRAKKHERELWQLTSSLLNVVIIALGLLALFGSIFSLPLLRLTVPGLPEGTLLIAAHVAKLSWFSVVTLCITRLLIAVYHSQYRFRWPSVVLVIGAGTTLILLLGLGRRFGIWGWAFAVVATGFMQVALLLPILLSRNRYYLRFGRHVRGFQESLKFMYPIILSNVVARTTTLVDRFIASDLSVGAISYLAYGNRLAIVVSTLLTTGIATTTFPLMAKHAADGNMIGFRHSISLSIRMVWIAAAPVISIMIALRYPLVALLFQRGAFTVADSYAVALLLPWYLLAVIGMALGDVVSRGLYSLKKTKTIAIIVIIESIAYALVASLLGHAFGYIGLAVACFLAFNLSLIVICMIIRHNTGGTGGRRVIKSFAHSGGAAILAGGAAYVAMLILKRHLLLSLLVGGGFGVAIYALILHLTHAEEWTILTGKLASFLKLSVGAADGSL